MRDIITIVILVVAIMLMITVSERQNTQDREIIALRLEIAQLYERISRESLTVHVRGVNKQYMEFYEVYPVVERGKK